MNNSISAEPQVATVSPKPRLSLFQIVSMSLGFFGIQFGFALQNGNASRILGTFGAEVESLSWFWLAAPLTGMIVQPLIGYYSDRTWTRLGRRRPYFLAGAILASCALILMPNAGALTSGIIPALYVGAGILMIMDASFNVAMEPFRALVADMLPSEQRTQGFSVQSILIGSGAIIGSVLPWVLKNWFNIGQTDNTTTTLPAATGAAIEASHENVVQDNVIYAFYVGAAVFMITILWTVFNTKEYPPGKLELQELKETKHKGLGNIISDFLAMPTTMKQLGVVQFFSWFALFSMWVFTTPAVANHVYGLPVTDQKSFAYNEAGDWVGILFGVYNGVAAIYGFILPLIARKLGRKSTHALSLLIGGIALISMFFIHDKMVLIIPMIGIGIAWASILAMPYAILAGSIPPHKMGIYMGVFNFFITIPQILNGIIGGPIVKYFYGSHAIYSLVMAGVFLILASFSVRFVNDADDVVVRK